MISDSVDQQLYNDTKLDQFGQVLKSAMLVYLSVELPKRYYTYNMVFFIYLKLIVFIMNGIVLKHNSWSESGLLSLNRLLWFSPDNLQQSHVDVLCIFSA